VAPEWRKPGLTTNPRQCEPMVRRRSIDSDRQLYAQLLDAYLDSCYSARKPATVGDFASAIALSRPYVSREFARVFGRSLSELLRDRQIKRACHLLLTTDRTMGEITALCAFG